MTEEQAQLIEDCEARESRLSEWERSFIASISFKPGITLSPKQAETLERIWEKVTERG